MLASGSGTPSSVASALLAWYDAGTRDLPWRSRSGPADSYRVWLSEIMLQQTTVAAVIPYFDHFTTRWPTVDALAAADDADVMRAWAGLGYYARARNLLACARTVVGTHGGRFPDSEAALRRLPGIGAYTAAAVAAIAFGRRAVVIDGNIERVVSRLFAVAEPLPRARPIVARHADAITPDDRPGDYAQAAMDLGATICRPRAPLCLVCPIRGLCEARRLGTPETFPVKAAKPLRPERTAGVYVLEHDGAVLLERRPASGLLGGMTGFPDTPPVPTAWTPRGRVRHVFTHFGLTLDVFHAKPGIRPDGLWWPVADLPGAGLPTLFRKVADTVYG